jgi:cysteine-rich repeat protein
MRRLLSVGLVALGALFALNQACGTDEPGSGFPAGTSSDAEAGAFTSSGFSSGAASSSSSSGSGIDSGPINDAPVAACGNGILDGNDACDDKNTYSNYGCSSTCLV